MRPSIIALLFLSVALAGCTSGPETDADALAETAPPTATAGTGAYSVSGTVTDASIQPLAGVRVTLEPQERTVSSDATGSWSFSGLTPGKYLVRFERDRFVSAARAVTIENVSATLDVLLLDAPSTDPYVDHHNVTGFIECAAGTPGHGQAAPGTDGVFTSCIAATPTFGGVGNPTNERIVIPFETRPNLTSLRITMTWSAGIPGTSQELSLLLEQSGTQGESGHEYARAAGTSPVVILLDQAALETLALGNGATLQTRTFPGGAAPSVAVQQDFDLVIERAYFDAALP